jgi:RimJ/RimL family protein N-acetyltransferase
MKLRPVGPHDWQFLYDLLAERPEHANISHTVMPTLAEHIGFLRSQPYAAWYIVETVSQERTHQPAGAIYLTHQAEIGIHIARDYQRRGLAVQAITELMRLHPKPRFLANISPQNATSLKMFNKLGFNLCQHTLELKA